MILEKTEIFWLQVTIIINMVANDLIYSNFYNSTRNFRFSWLTIKKVNLVLFFSIISIRKKTKLFYFCFTMNLPYVKIKTIIKIKYIEIWKAWFLTDHYTIVSNKLVYIIRWVQSSVWFSRFVMVYSKWNLIRGL